MALEIDGQTVTASVSGAAVSRTALLVAAAGTGPKGGQYLLRLRNTSTTVPAYLIPPGQAAEGTPADAVKWAEVPISGTPVTLGPYAVSDGAPLLQTTASTAVVSAQILYLRDGEAA